MVGCGLHVLSDPLPRARERGRIPRLGAPSGRSCVSRAQPPGRRRRARVGVRSPGYLSGSPPAATTALPLADPDPDGVPPGSADLGGRSAAGAGHSASGGTVHREPLARAHLQRQHGGDSPLHGCGQLRIQLPQAGQPQVRPRQPPAPSPGEVLSPAAGEPDLPVPRSQVLHHPRRTPRSPPLQFLDPGLFPGSRRDLGAPRGGLPIRRRRSRALVGGRDGP